MKKFTKTLEEMQEFLSSMGLDVTMFDLKKAVKQNYMNVSDYEFYIGYNEKNKVYKLEG